MEKFSKWRDEKTSISPFVPPKAKSPRSIVGKLLVGPVVFLLRLPFLVAAFCLYFVAASLAALLPSAVRRVPERVVHAVGARLLLLLLGFWWIDAKHVRLSRKAKLPTSVPGSHAASGDLIVANLQSYPELLYLAYRYAPTFTAVPLPSEGKVVPRSIFGALADACAHSKVVDASQAVSVTEALAEAERSGGGPLVVFPEGASSNGRALLADSGVLEGAEVRAERTHVVAFKYEWTSFCPAFTVGSALVHVYCLASRLSNSLTAKYLVAADVPSNPAVDVHRQSEVTGDGAWHDVLYRQLESTTRLRRTALGQEEKREFVAFWYASKKRGYTKGRKEH